MKQLPILFLSLLLSASFAPSSASARTDYCTKASRTAKRLQVYAKKLLYYSKLFDRKFKAYKSKRQHVRTTLQRQFVQKFDAQFKNLQIYPKWNTDTLKRSYIIGFISKFKKFKIDIAPLKHKLDWSKLPSTGFKIQASLETYWSSETAPCAPPSAKFGIGKIKYTKAVKSGSKISKATAMKYTPTKLRALYKLRNFLKTLNRIKLKQSIDETKKLMNTNRFLHSLGKRVRMYRSRVKTLRANYIRELRICLLMKKRFKGKIPFKKKAELDSEVPNTKRCGGESDEEIQNNEVDCMDNVCQDASLLRGIDGTLNDPSVVGFEGNFCPLPDAYQTDGAYHDGANAAYNSWP